jgi:hypothetical protein
MSIKVGSNNNVVIAYEVTLQQGEEIRTNLIMASSLDQVTGPLTRSYARNGWTLTNAVQITARLVDGVVVKVGA